MGIAVLSGVLESLEPRSLENHFEKWETHTPGTVTPSLDSNPALPSKFYATVSTERSAKRLRKHFGALANLGPTIQVTVGKNAEVAKQADVVLLCCKPQLARSILSEEGMKEALKNKLLISILAGVTIIQLRGLVDSSTRVVRTMPNTPCQIREGMTVISSIPSSPDVENDRTIIMSIFSSIGRCLEMDEKHFDACTALSGSGPAFVCVMLEALSDGGVAMGLPRAAALELAAQTTQGAARMVLQAGVHPAQLRDAVTTPGGSTIAGLLTLEDGKIRSTVARTIQVATERASQLGRE